MTASPQPKVSPSTARDEDAREVVGRVVRLHADAEHAALAHRVAAPRHVANLRGGVDEVLVPHQLRDRRGDLGRDRPLQRAKRVAGRGVVEEEFAELADRERANAGERGAVVGVEDEPRHVVRVGVDDGLIDDGGERHVGEGELGRDALALGARGEPGELVAGLRLVRLREQFAEVGEDEPLAADGVREWHVEAKRDSGSETVYSAMTREPESGLGRH